MPPVPSYSASAAPSPGRRGARRAGRSPTPVRRLRDQARPACDEAVGCFDREMSALQRHNDLPGLIIDYGLHVVGLGEKAPQRDIDSRLIFRELAELPMHPSMALRRSSGAFEYESLRRMKCGKIGSRPASSVRLTSSIVRAFARDRRALSRCAAASGVKSQRPRSEPPASAESVPDRLRRCTAWRE